MKVGIFETEHFEAAYPLVRLFDDGRNEITLFTYPAARRQLEYMLDDSKDRYRWITKEEHQSRASFIRTIYKEVKKQKIELLYLNTVTDNFLLYALLVNRLPEVRVIATVHIINSFFITRHQYRPKKLLTAIGKKWLQKEVKEFNVLAPAMVPELQQRLPAGKKIYSIPGTVYEEKNTRAHSLQNPVHIVIPGSIDGRRRNYEQVFDLLMLLQKEDIPVSVTLSGTFYKEYGDKILSRCKQWKATNQQLHYYEDGPVDQPEFDRVMQEADLIFIPSVVHTMIDEDVEETYGLTITSGNMSDVIRHAKPFIIPKELIIDPALEKSCIRYNHIKDIVDFILLTHEDTWIYANLQQAATEAAEEFSVKGVRERNRELFQ